MTSYKPILFTLFVLFAGFSSLVAIKTDVLAEALQDKQKSQAKSAAVQDAVKAQIKADLKAGKITEAEAKEKFQALYNKKSDTITNKLSLIHI